MDSNMTDDNTELEALFDSIAYGHTAAPAEEPASVPANETHACASEIGIRCAPENVSSCHVASASSRFAVTACTGLAV